MEQTTQPHVIAAADAAPQARAAFIRRTYLHLAGAIAAFAAVEAWLLQSTIGEQLIGLMMRGGQMGWLVVIACFIGVSWLADSLARSRANTGTQYMGLGLFVLAEAVIFLPMIDIAMSYTGAYPGDASLVTTAGLMTLLLVAGLTATVFITRADFSFMKNILTIGFLLALGAMLIGAFTGFSLGLWFSVAMVGLAAGSVLYTTSNILHHYGTEDHVAASLSLFASVAMLFWYILRILLAFANRD